MKGGGREIEPDASALCLFVIYARSEALLNSSPLLLLKNRGTRYTFAFLV
jgi:hypothetical protein